MLKKRRLGLSVVALLLLVLPVLGACGGGTTETPPAQKDTAAKSAGQPAQPTAAAQSGQQAQPTAAAKAANSAAPAPSGKEITVTLPHNAIESFDTAYWTAQLLLSQGTLFEGLYGYDENLKVVPKVAESASHNEDNSVWTFKLRKDKKWSNGDPVTAKDFYVAWMRGMGPELKDAPLWAGFLGQVKNAYAFKAGAVKPEEVGVKLVDDYTLEVTLIKGNAALPNMTVLASAMPIHAKTLEAHPNDWWQPANWVSNGPYVVKSWTNGGDTVLTRNPNYVGDGIGNVTTIVLKPYTDPNARMQAFENGEIQYTALQDASQLAYARNNPQMKSNIKEDLQTYIWQGIEWDRSTNYGPWTDERVRKAFAMSIDKQAITDKILKGMAAPTNAFTGDPDVTGKVKPLPYDVAQAKQLLADAGFPGGKGFPEVTFYAPPANDARMPTIEAIAKMWQDNLGVKVTIQNQEAPVYNKLQWNNYNLDTKPGYAWLGGPANWYEPVYLLLNANHIFYFMDYKPEWQAKKAQYDQKIADVDKMNAAGDWATLEKRANDVWGRFQQFVAQENNEWGKDLTTPPTFKEQFDRIAQRFNNAADDKAKLGAYKDAERLVLTMERDTEEHYMRTDKNKEAMRLQAKLTRSTMDQANQYVVPIQQIAVDSAWMVPLYNEKIFYATDPRLSGIVINKFSWGNIFQFQYLKWTEK